MFQYLDNFITVIVQILQAIFVCLSLLLTSVMGLQTNRNVYKKKREMMNIGKTK